MFVCAWDGVRDEWLNKLVCIPSRLQQHFCGDGPSPSCTCFSRWQGDSLAGRGEEAACFPGSYEQERLLEKALHAEGKADGLGLFGGGGQEVRGMGRVCARQVLGVCLLFVLERRSPGFFFVLSFRRRGGSAATGRGAFWCHCVVDRRQGPVCQQ